MIDRRKFLGVSAAAGGALAVGGWRIPGTHDAAPWQTRAPGAKPLKILILGGTGLTGPFQVRYVLARGHSVTVFNRGRRNERLPDGVEELIGDRQLHQVEPLKGREWDVVIDNPTTLPFWIKDVGEVLAGHTKQFVMISTISVYDSAGQTAINESSPLVEYKGGDPLKVTQTEFAKDVEHLYGQMKTASEREARKWFGDRTTIIRPGLIVGPGDASFRFTYWPYRIERGGEILAPGDGTDAIQIIDARDLAEWTIRMVENQTFGTFNGVGPRSPLSMAEQLYGIRGALPGDIDLAFTWVPSAFLAAQKVSAWGEMPTWIPSSDPDSAQSRADISRALAAGLTFRPLATTAVDALAWFKAQPEADRARMVKSAGIAPEKEKAVLAAWHEQAKRRP